MKNQLKFLFANALLTLVLCAQTLLAQAPERRPIVPTMPTSQDRMITSNAGLPPVSNSTDVLSGEIVNLRKSLQTLNKRLGEIGEKLFASAPKEASVGNQNRILLNLDVLTRAEQRAEVLRRQLIELSEKETQMKTRGVLNEEDMRPESIDRTLTTAGSTRAPELRDARRRVLENERDGLRALLAQVQQSRSRLENDVREADALVTRLRQRILPIIERELQNLDAKQP